MATVAAPVQAEWYFTERGAEKVTRDAVYKRYGYSRFDLSVVCRPQGADDADPAYKYHRWVCSWATSSKDRCDDASRYIVGTMLIAGHSGAGSYGYKALRGAQCTD
jgi:hypothetical protein